MITKAPRFTILIVAMTVLGTSGPIAAFATAYGGNEDSLADRITEDVDRIIEEEVGDIDVDELPTITPPTSMPPAVFCDEQPATIVGTSGDDFLVGTEGRDVIAGLGGNDEIHGFGGDDSICGHEGDDRIVGGDGNDRMYGHDGNDFINGNEGDDVIFGHDGVDGLFGDDGNDRMYGGAGGDVMVGGAGNDEMLGNQDDDIMVGGAGNDAPMLGGAGNDELDSIDGVVNNDRLNGETGIDTCASDPDPENNCES
jgi:Ca2+-binding RTX toxin-like protein